MQEKSPQQQIGDACHAARNRSDEQLIELGALLTKSATFAMHNSVSAKEKHRTYSQIGQAITATIEMNEKIMLAHFSMQKIAETADVPFNCPPDNAEAKPDLKVVA